MPASKSKKPARKAFRGGTVKGGGATPGTYEATFIDAELVERTPEAVAKEWAEQFVMRFQVEDSEQVLNVFGNVTAGPRTAIYPLLCSMLGRDLAPGEDWDLEPLIGERFSLTFAKVKGVVKPVAIEPLG